MTKFHILLLLIPILLGYLYIKSLKKQNSDLKNKLRKSVPEIDFDLQLLILKNFAKNRQNFYFSERTLVNENDLSYNQAHMLIGRLISLNQIKRIYSVRCAACEHPHYTNTHKEMESIENCEVCTKKMEQDSSNYYSLYQIIEEK